MELFLEPRLEGEDGGVWKLNLESPPLAARSWMTWKKPKKITIIVAWRLNLRFELVSFFSRNKREME